MHGTYSVKLAFPQLFKTPISYEMRRFIDVTEIKNVIINFSVIHTSTLMGHY